MSPARPARLGRALLVASCAAAILAPPQSQASDGTKLTFYPSLHLRFVAGAADNYFLSRGGVVNTSGAAMTGLTLRQKFPEGFKPRLISAEQQLYFKRTSGFSESLDGNTYAMKLSELRIAEDQTLAVLLDYEGRPGLVTFPGVEVEYTQDGVTRTEKGPDQTWDLSRYTKYSGTLREFIKRYAGMELAVGDSGDDWGFTNVAAMAAGRPNATGAVEIDSDQMGRMRFSLAAGAPGNLRQIHVIRRKYDPARYPKASDEVRRLVIDSIQSTSDFSLDSDNAEIKRGKLGRWDAWILETRWRDKVKDRLGEGPATWYLFADEKTSMQYLIGTSAQGRGGGAGKADVPAPDREAALMSELQKVVSSLRLIS